MKITVNEQIILMALARFKFLTSDQMKHILGCKSLSTVNSALRRLKAFRFSLVKTIGFGVVPWKWRVAPIHHLTKAGRQRLLEWTALQSEEIQLPSGSSVHFQQDYYHRVSTVWFVIFFQQWLAVCGYRLIDMKVYFNSSFIDGQFRTQTRIWSGGRYIEPDAIAVYRAEGVDQTILFEQHNGNDPKRALRQIKQHAMALLHTKTKNVRVVYVFQNSASMAAVVQAIQSCPKMQIVQNCFLFKTENELRRQFSESWHRSDGTLVSFLS